MNVLICKIHCKGLINTKLMAKDNLINKEIKDQDQEALKQLKTKV
jgi:hypothetical protein